MPNPRNRNPRPTLGTILQNILRDRDRVAVIGIGSDLRGDDGAGILVVRKILESVGPIGIDRFKCFEGGAAPENITGEVIAFHPAHLIMIDAADMGMPDGRIRIIDPERIGGVTFSTHSLPLSILWHYLVQAIGCRMTLIGIQPKQLEFGSELSPVMLRAVNRLARAFQTALTRTTGL